MAVAAAAAVAVATLLLLLLLRNGGGLKIFEGRLNQTHFEAGSGKLMVHTCMYMYG